MYGIGKYDEGKGEVHCGSPFTDTEASESRLALCVTLRGICMPVLSIATLAHSLDVIE